MFDLREYFSLKFLTLIVLIIASYFDNFADNCNLDLNKFDEGFKNYYENAKYIEINNNNNKRLMGNDRSRYNSVEAMNSKDIDEATKEILKPIRSLKYA